MKEKRFVREFMEMKQRTVLLSFMVAAIFFLLLLRLWHLQILNADDYRSKSEDNRLRFVPIAASRGAIMDRNATVLVSNQPSFSLAVVPQEVKDKEALLDQLVSLLGVDREELAERWKKGQGRARYYPIVLAANITRDQVEIIEENHLRLPGVEIEVKPVRQYASGMLASHLMGYIGEVSEDELSRKGNEAYNPGDYIGKNGIERAWEAVLHGRDGGRQLEVDARGRVLRTISETQPLVGNSVVLTIDARIQQGAESAFGEQAGAAVAMDVNSGEILAFVSNPGFDPALFSGKMPPDVWKQYLEDKRRPLENKALSGQYPPGSTFKIITALAGLENNLVDENSSVSCSGAYRMGTSTFKCWNRHGHGSVNLKKSLRESCDVYYYHLGERLGVDRIAATARQFMLGSPMGIGLKHEKGGLIPSIAWKQKRFGKAWIRGETPSVSIGQGYVLMTPIQLASMIATVANEGTIYRPQLVKRIVDADGRTLREFGPERIGTTGISARSFRLVKQGLFAVVNERGGTGGAARVGYVTVAGKTGTSQVVKLRDSRGGIPYQYRDHALFVAFAPFEKPEIAVAVVIEHGEHGGSAAAPIAGRIIRTWYETKHPPKPVARPVAEKETEAEEETDEAPATEQQPHPDGEERND
ncbi:penicillin-binding protein 2 [Pelobacter propionicus]|uniref:Peptidoglycan glycosyltransferase n=1 Tax=Pelobacter propionicus (strain DSM 2379 / NBRC 103807 / OttBd1) TaxID=338966 RepID=A1AS29_PELPD|nr:penicillin-binding protein 2 [Pelobacter propionicus]ABL00150.1 peptidoglycan glycosyltransferase [Pelobacter propionicus DSM 2379]